MIFFDKVGHLISDRSVEELHLFANKLGLKRAWFQDKKTGDFYYPHYDLTTDRMRLKAEMNGAVRVDPREIIRLLRTAPYNLNSTDPQGKPNGS